MPRLLGMVEATWIITEPAQPMTLLPLDELLERSHRHADRLRSLLASLPADHAVFAVREPCRGTR